MTNWAKKRHRAHESGTVNILKLSTRRSRKPEGGSLAVGDLSMREGRKGTGAKSPFPR
jgi:hypothetical protein